MLGLMIQLDIKAIKNVYCGEIIAINKLKYTLFLNHAYKYSYHPLDVLLIAFPIWRIPVYSRDLKFPGLRQLFQTFDDYILE